MSNPAVAPKPILRLTFSTSKARATWYRYAPEMKQSSGVIYLHDNKISLIYTYPSDALKIRVQHFLKEYGWKSQMSWKVDNCYLFPVEHHCPGCDEPYEGLCGPCSVGLERG